jgi:hypothetical protein
MVTVKKAFKHYVEVMKSFILADEPQKAEMSDKNQKNELIDLSNVPVDTMKNILAHCPVFELLYVIPRACKFIKTIVSKEFVLNTSKEYPKFILKQASLINPSKLFCFYYVNSFFDTVHDLVKYRFEQNPGSLQHEWLLMVYERFYEYKAHLDVIRKSFDAQLRSFRKLYLDDQKMPHTEYDAFCDIVTERQDFTEIFVRKSNRQQILRLILTCKNGWKLLKATLD